MNAFLASNIFCEKLYEVSHISGFSENIFGQKTNLKFANIKFVKLD